MAQHVEVVGSAPEHALAPRTDTAPTAASETSAIFSLIERVARDPSVDIDRLERLLDMQERTVARNAKAAFVAALAQMQPELPTITERGGIKDRAGNVQSTYAKWEDINDAIKPVLARFGFALSFRTRRDGDRIITTGVLSHREGHSEETTQDLPVDASGSKNAVQAVGSSTSYGKRYTAMALLNITSRAPGEHDDDGQAAGGPATITEEQLIQLRELIETVEADEVRFAKFMKVDKLADLPADRFEKAVAELKAFGRNRGGRA